MKKKNVHIDETDDMLPEYDFSNAVQGKYAKQYAKGTNVVVIDPDLMSIFPSSESVNHALHSIASLIREREARRAGSHRASAG